jgi:hypothetical protein
MVYQAALRTELHERLDVRFREVNENGQADIAGVPDALLELWSKRTATIDAEAAPRIAEYEKRLGRTMTAAERTGVVKTAVLKTRPANSTPSCRRCTRPGRPRPPRSAGRRNGSGARRVCAPDGPALGMSGGCRLPNRPVREAPPRRRSGPGRSGGGGRGAAGCGGAAGGVLPCGRGRAGRRAPADQRRERRGGRRAGRAAHRPRPRPAGRRPGDVGSEGRDGAGVGRPLRHGAGPVAEARILDLAARGRRGRYGQVAYTAVMAAGRSGRLDPSQAGQCCTLPAGPSCPC